MKISKYVFLFGRVLVEVNGRHKNASAGYNMVIRVLHCAQSVLEPMDVCRNDLLTEKWVHQNARNS